MAALKLIRNVKNGALYETGEGDKKTQLVMLKDVRFSYPFLGTPGVNEKDNGDKEKKWRVVGMLPKQTHVEVKDLLKSVILDLIKKADATVPQANWCLSNGDDKEDELMHGHWLVSAADGKIRPTARNANGTVIDEISEIDRIFYGGMWGNMLVRPWYFNGQSGGKKYPKRVPAGITGVQFVRNDDPFGQGRIDDSDAFGAVEGVDGAGMDDDTDGL